MIPPACQRFGEKVMRQLNNSARDRMQNRTLPLPIPPHRLSRTIGATPAEKQLRLRQKHSGIQVLRPAKVTQTMRCGRRLGPVAHGGPLG
jgi:hypothetical protein